VLDGIALDQHQPALGVQGHRLDHGQAAPGTGPHGLGYAETPAQGGAPRDQGKHEDQRQDEAQVTFKFHGDFGVLTSGVVFAVGVPGVAADGRAQFLVEPLVLGGQFRFQPVQVLDDLGQ
jgi:hypothetical protein